MTSAPPTVPPIPIKVPISVAMVPAESIYRTENSKMYVLSGTYVKFKAFFLKLMPDNGLAIPSCNLYLRVQAHDDKPVRIDVCVRVLSINGVHHDYGTMAISMGGNPTPLDAYAFEAHAHIAEWAVPAKIGVPIYPDKTNTVVVRFEAYLGTEIVSTTMIVYTLDPMPVKS